MRSLLFFLVVVVVMVAVRGEVVKEEGREEVKEGNTGQSRVDLEMLEEEEEEGEEELEEVGEEEEEGGEEELEVGEEEGEKEEGEEELEEVGEEDVIGGEELGRGEEFEDYDNARIEEAALRKHKNRCEKKGGYCKLPMRGWCKTNYSPSNNRNLCDTKDEICCVKKTGKPKCGMSSICTKKGGWCMSKKEKCQGTTISKPGICGSKQCMCCVENKPPGPTCDPERAICRKCGEAPIEVARLADNDTREVQANTYDIEGNVITKGTRIIGGDKASPLEYPFHVFLTNNNGTVNCGGTIIARKWVLTAAHCMAPLNGDFSKLLVGLGSNFRDMMTYLPVVRVIIHENFVQVQDGDDVALIELPLELIFESNDVVQPVCLAEAEDLMPGKDMVTTGWGFLFPFANSLPNDLFEVSVTQVDANICTYFTEIPSDQGKVVCTINMAKSTCIGDSGGPLVVQLCDGRWVQTGITSYGESGCSQPRVFASVSYYKNWIIDKIKPTTIC